MFGEGVATVGTAAIPPLASSVLTFKFTDSAGEYRRVKLPTTTAVGCYDRLLGEVRRRYGAPAGSELKLKFKDEDGDDVVLGCDEDLAECLSVAADAGLKIMPLQVSRTTAPAVASPAATAAVGVEAVSVSTPPTDDHATAGNRALHRNDVDGALAAYAAALTLQPDCVLALAGRGAARLILNDAAAAETDYRSALAALDGDAGDGGDGGSSSGRR
eukprot:contig_30681_g7500